MTHGLWWLLSDKWNFEWLPHSNKRWNPHNLYRPPDLSTFVKKQQSKSKTHAPTLPAKGEIDRLFLPWKEGRRKLWIIEETIMQQGFLWKKILKILIMAARSVWDVDINTEESARMFKSSVPGFIKVRVTIWLTEFICLSETETLNPYLSVRTPLKNHICCM